MGIAESLLEKGVLLSPEVVSNPRLMEILSQIDPSRLVDVDIIDLAFFDRISSQQQPPQNNFSITFSYDKKPSKISVNDFVSYFNRRFEAVGGFLQQRQEFERIVSINRLKGKTEREAVCLIGMVYEKTLTKKNNIILTLEDPTGTINVLVKAEKREAYAMAKDIVLDETIGVEGFLSDGFIFANQIYLPEVPSTKEYKKGPAEEYLVTISDLHFGAKLFLKEEFEDFIEWINGRKGNEEQRAIASKIKYLVIAGDLVEGVGIYPDQEKDLEVKDIQEQYDLFTEYLRKIPSSIRIFVCPGNHDVGRISDPQPPMKHKYSGGLQALPNVSLVSSPSIVTVGKTRDFGGFDILIYHGYSFIYYADQVESIRTKGGLKRSDLLMRFLLQRRHLAPSHTSNLYIPDTVEDPLVLKKIPDFFISGHIHRVSVNNYKNITLINSSCWIAITEYEEKLGLQPQPAKVVVVNLKSRDVKIMNFLKDNKEENGKLKPELKAVPEHSEGKAK